MARTPFPALGLALIASLTLNVSRAETTERPYFGEALYHAYQGQWFEALEQLNTELRSRHGGEDPELDGHWYESVDDNFSVGDFELNYRMDRHAARVIQASLEDSVDEAAHADAAYRLARLHFRKGRAHDALRALDRISGDVPGDIRDDVAFLRAGIYLALEWSEPAIPLLEKLLRSKEYGAYAAYNLGIAYLQGDFAQSAHDQLDRAGRIKPGNDADAAMKDKANLVLGTLFLKEDQHRRGLEYLKRVRLEGPFSSRALLGAGWAHISSGQPKQAIVTWNVLAERDPTDRAVQEAMLALPYAYSQLGLHSQAAGYYSRALNAYTRELKKLSQSIESIRAGHFLRALSNDESRNNEDWVIRLRSLPDTPETFYLMELLASNDFQTGLENYLDLADLKRRLSARSTGITAFDELVAARERRYEPLLPEVDAQFRDLDARLEQRQEHYAALAEQRARIVAGSRPERAARLAELDRKLRALDGALAEAQTQHDRFLLARQAAGESFTGFDEPLDRLSDRTREALATIDDLLERQGRLLEKLAADELTARLRRLEVYASKARFGLADSKDRMQRQEQP